MSARRKALVTVSVAVAIGVVAVPASAQRGQTAELTGVVTDASRGVLAGAKMAIASPQLIGGLQQTVTDLEGRYRFPVLLPGIYEVTAAADGFKTVKRSAIELPPGLGITIDFQLELAPVAEVVNVEAATAPIDVHTSAAPVLIDRGFIDNLPIVRDSFSIIWPYLWATPGIDRSTFGGSNVVPFSIGL